MSIIIMPGVYEAYRSSWPPLVVISIDLAKNIARWRWHDETREREQPLTEFYASLRGNYYYARQKPAS